MKPEEVYDRIIKRAESISLTQHTRPSLIYESYEKGKKLIESGSLENGFMFFIRALYIYRYLYKFPKHRNDHILKKYVLNIITEADKSALLLKKQLVQKWGKQNLTIKKLHLF